MSKKTDVAKVWIYTGIERSLTDDCWESFVELKESTKENNVEQWIYTCRFCEELVLM